jgi:TonB-linked SusC/RagA family outer membrane protein
MRSKFKWIFTLLLAFSLQLSFAQEKTVTGVVSDATGPIPGANVVVKGTTRGVQTDIDGKYAITAKQGDVLQFSFLGMETFEATVGASNVINATLAEGATSIGEVVVTGALGIRKRVDQQTSTTTVVKATEISQAAAPTVTQGLVGKVSGVQITQTNNSVNASTRIVINGPRSISGDNAALVVIDGAISTSGVLNSIPPDMIDNVTILKGLQGSALYGADGVNGVVIVTTKRGATGEKMAVTVTSSVDFQEVAYLPIRQTRYGQGWFGELVSIENGAWGSEMDGSMQPVGLPQEDGSFIMAPYRGDHKNIKKFFQTGTILQQGVSISGGNLTDGFVNFSINRQDREFVVPGDEFKRTNFAFRGGKQVGKWTVEGNAQYFSSTQRNTTSTLYEDLLQTATNVPIERFRNAGMNYHWNVYYQNPYWMRDNIRFRTTEDYFNGQTSLSYKFNDNISATWLASVQFSSAGTENFTNEFAAEDDLYTDYNNRFVIGAYNSSSSTSRRIYSDLMLNFDYDLTESVSLAANIGANVQDIYGKTNQVGGSELDVAGFYNYTNILEPSLASALTNTWSRQRRFALFANVDLGYKEYLNLNLTARNDWISTLNPDNRSFFYPSVGVAFVPTKAFEGLQNNNTLNYAKLSAGWTRNGNTRAVNTYAIDPVVAIAAGFPYGELSSFAFPTTVTANDIKPEFVTSVEVGLQLGFFKDRLTFDAQMYRQTTTDLITGRTTSSASGIGRQFTNVAEMETNGFNIDLGFTPVKGDFTWDAKVNFSTYEAIVNKVTEDSDEVNLQSTTLVGVFAVKGEDFPLIKGIGYERDDQGRVIIDATTGNPVYTSEFIKLGKVNPDFILGFTNSFSYKGLKLTAVCDYRTGHKYYSEARGQLAWTGNLIESAENGRDGGFIFPNSVIEDPNNPGSFIPNTSVVTGGNSYASYQTYFSNDHYNNNAENNVIDATAFKVRELALSYTLPKDMVRNMGMSDLTFGVNARNPFMWLPKENRNYNDPEQSNTTGNAAGLAATGQYPYTRTFGFTINAKF